MNLTNSAQTWSTEACRSSMENAIFTWSVQKLKFSIKNFFSKCDKIDRKLRIWSHLLKKSLMKNFIFFAQSKWKWHFPYLICMLKSIRKIFLILIFIIWRHIVGFERSAPVLEISWKTITSEKLLLKEHSSYFWNQSFALLRQSFYISFYIYTVRSEVIFSKILKRVHFKSPYYYWKVFCKKISNWEIGYFKLMCFLIVLAII